MATSNGLTAVLTNLMADGPAAAAVGPISLNMAGLVHPGTTYLPFMAMATGLEAYAVNRTVDFRLAQQGGDLLMQRGIQGQVGDFETLRLGMSQTGRVDVPDEHHRSAPQARGGSSRMRR